MIASWLVDKRVQTCAACQEQSGCVAKFDVATEAPACPLNRLPSKVDEIAARAWPEGAQQVSGCCDSANNYL